MQILHQPISAALPNQGARLDQSAHVLLQKEGVTFRALNKELLEERQPRDIPEQSLEEGVGAHGR